MKSGRKLLTEEGAKEEARQLLIAEAEARQQLGVQRDRGVEQGGWAWAYSRMQSGLWGWSCERAGMLPCPSHGCDLLK